MLYDAACDVAARPLLLLLPRNFPIVGAGVDSGDTRESDSAIAKILNRVGRGKPMAAQIRERRAVVLGVLYTTS